MNKPYNVKFYSSFWACRLLLFKTLSELYGGVRMGNNIQGQSTWKENKAGCLPSPYNPSLLSPLHRPPSSVWVLEVFFLHTYFNRQWKYTFFKNWVQFQQLCNDYSSMFPFFMYQFLSQVVKNRMTNGQRNGSFATCQPLSLGKCDSGGPSFCEVADRRPGLWIPLTYDPPFLLRSLSSKIYVGIRRGVNLPWKPCAGKRGWSFRSWNTCFICLTYMGTLGLLWGPKSGSQAFIVNRWCC